jgi:membrane-bound metal-dependent hydrolase YbcI (DUF457 family)
MLYLTPALFPILPLAGIAFLTGGLFHLLEDTCTVSGVAWVYPFRTGRFCGSIQTGNAWDIRPKVYEGMLAAGIVVLVIASSQWPYTSDSLPGMGAVLLIALWIVFLTASGVHYKAGMRTAVRKTSYL